MVDTVTRVAGIVIKDGKILMLLGKGYNELWTPGGKTEPNESDEDCLKRELKEELGVNLSRCEFFKEYKHKSFYFPKRLMTERVYIADVSGEINPGAEIEKHLWLTKEDFENKRFPMITNTQEKLIPDLIKAKLW